MKKQYKFLLPLVLLLSIFWYYSHEEVVEPSNQLALLEVKILEPLKPKKKTQSSRQLFSEQRLLHEFNMQKNPLTGLIPKEEKQRELTTSLAMKEQNRFRRTSQNTYTSRGPSNFGGRTRAFAVDISDVTSNTMFSGGVSSGLFRTTNGGDSWTKVSPNDEIHNVTALAQDPRVGHQNKWYYATGEWRGNSASLVGSFYRGRGVWQSTNSGLTWTQIPATDSVFENYDNDFDYISALEVNLITGHLFIATNAINKNIYRYDGTSFTKEFNIIGSGWTDVVIATNGRVFASLENSGVWTSPTGNGSWTLIAENGTPTDWASTGRIVLGEAPSNPDVIYALYVNGNLGSIEADLWQYNLSSDTWTDYSSKLPDEPNGDLVGNDPFAVQGGYDLVVSVKPDNENYVLIGGTNIYKIEDITTDATSANPTWSLVEQNLSNHSIRSAAITTVNNEIRYFVGTARGLYSNSDPENDNWVLEGPNTIGLAVISSLVYRPSDNKLLIGTHGNGMFETTIQGTFSTKNFTKTTDVYVYPNPTQDVLNFRSKTLDFSATVTYEIYNLTGKRILNGTLNNQKVDVRLLNSGVYFVNLNVGNTTQSLKFIKN
jgi:hypothetical protein